MAGQDRPPPWWVDPTENVKALVEAAMARQDDLREMQAVFLRELQGAEIRRLDEKADLRAAHAEQMRRAETERLDAIRSVDVSAVQRAAEVQAAQQQALAAQVTTTADAFRASLSAALAPIQTSIEDLRRAQYEAQGQKTQVIETREGSRVSFGLLIGLGGLILALLTLYLTKK